MAVISRILLVLAIGWVMRLKDPWVTLLGHSFSGKDLILLGGGLFLLVKATYEIHHRIEAANTAEQPSLMSSLLIVLLQIMAIDVVFSLDSVITAVGMTDGIPNAIPIMVLAILISVAIMLAFSRAIVSFIERHTGHQDPGLGVPADDRCVVGRRRIPSPDSQGLCLFCDGVLAGCGDPADDVPIQAGHCFVIVFRHRSGSRMFGSTLPGRRR